MMRHRMILLGGAGVVLGLVSMLALAAGLPPMVALRFTDMPLQPLPSAAEAVAPEAPAAAWLRQQGWERVWPLGVEGRESQVTFAGPPGQRFLRLTIE